MVTTYISRLSLLNRLKANTPLVYIYDPAGSGKTALLREWSSLQGEQVVWFTCSEIDNDPLCLWQRMTHIVGIEGNDAAFVPGLFPSTLEVAMISLTNWFEHQQCTIHLVIDDYHLLHTNESGMLIRHLLQIRPPGLRIYITSHFRDGDLPLSRWCLSGQAIEITPADLAFTGA